MTNKEKKLVRVLREKRMSYEDIAHETLISIDKISEFCKEENINERSDSK